VPGWSALKSGLVGASASGAAFAAGGAFGFTCAGAGADFGTEPIGAICASAGATDIPASTLVSSNVRKPRDIVSKPFISNENPSPRQSLQRLLIARQSPGRHSRRKSRAEAVRSQTNP
jgi:hypothetical protein